MGQIRILKFERFHSFLCIPNPSLGLSSSKTGIKDKLRDSAEYPREFGVAVGGLIGNRKPPLQSEISDLSYSGAGPDLGALDDLIKGSERTWWRNL